MVHPSVKGAESFRYQIWPVDTSCRWVEVFGTFPFPKHCWRAVRSSVSLRFNENRRTCPCNSTRDVFSVQAIGRGLDVAGSMIQKPVARRALRSKVHETVLSQNRVVGKTVVKNGAVKKAVKKKAIGKKAVKKEKSVEKKSVEKKSVEKKSVEKKSVRKKSVEKKPVEKKPVEGCTLMQGPAKKSVKNKVVEKTALQNAVKPSK
jgi:hypothetical protein